MALVTAVRGRAPVVVPIPGPYVAPAPPPPIGPWRPTYNLRANNNTVFHLRANQATVFTVRASPLTTFNRRASVMSISSNLVFYLGEDIVLNFQMTPVQDITGWTITWKAALGLGGTIEIAESATVIDGPRGRFQVTIASATTASLAVGRYVWDCRREDSGNKATLADGYMDLKQPVVT